MKHTKSHVCRLAAGPFKRDAIPKSAGKVKNQLCLENMNYILKNRGISTLFDFRQTDVIIWGLGAIRRQCVRNFTKFQ
jgi:1,6-anhydro-N-acetylmuramate kinase